MPRTKKDKTTVETKSEEKKKRGARLDEHCKYATFITDDIVPYIAENINEIDRIAQYYLTNKEISKDDWTYLYDIVDKCCDMAAGHDMIAFNRYYMTGKYSKATHSSFFMVQTTDYARYMCKHIEQSKKWDITNVKELGYYQTDLYLVAQHMFFFINVKEKLGLT